MTVVAVPITKYYVGLAADAKPTSGIPAGAKFLELDTGKEYRFDGSAWQAVPLAAAPQDQVLFPSAARTAAQQLADQTNQGFRGIYLTLDVTAASGTGGLTVRIQGKDPASGKYNNLNAAPTAVIAISTVQYVLYPSTAITAVTQATVSYLPRTWRIVVSVGDASSYTYSVGAWLLP